MNVYQAEKHKRFCVSITKYASICSSIIKYPYAAILLGLICFVMTIPAPAGTITIKGSDTMLILNRELSSEYGTYNPLVKFEVQAGGSQKGIEALLKGEIDIAAASRAMEENEKQAFEQMTGSKPTEIIVALDGIGIYVHNNNPISSLTIAQFSEILSGKIRNWSEIGGFNRRIDLYNRDKNSGTRSYIKKHVLKGNDFSNLGREVSTTSMMTSCVSRNQNAIGYGGIAYSPGSHIIRLSDRSGHAGYWPSYENVTSGKYPLARPLYFYVNPKSDNPDLQPFLDWVKSPTGQKVVSFVGYYPASTGKDKKTSPVLKIQPAEKPQVPVENKPAKNFKPSTSSQSSIHDGPIELTPETLKSHNFDFTIKHIDAGTSKRPDRVMVTLNFDPGGHSIHGINTVSVRIGDDAVIPVTLSSDFSTQFVLRKPLIWNTSISLTEVGAPLDGNVYTIELRDFYTGN